MKLSLSGILFAAFALFSSQAVAQNYTVWGETSSGGGNTIDTTIDPSGDYGDSTLWSNGVPSGAANGTIGVIPFNVSSTGSVVNNPSPVITITVSAAESAQALEALGNQFPITGVDTSGNTGGVLNLNINSGIELTVSGASLLGSAIDPGNALLIDYGATTNITGAGSGTSMVIQGGDVEVGDSNGPGTLNLSGNFDYSSSDVYVGVGSSVTGTMSQQSGTVNEASLTIGTQSGNGTYTVDKGGHLTITGNLTLGTGTITQSGTSTVSANSIDIGDVGTGIYNQSGSSAVSATTLYIGDAGGTGTYNLSNGTLTLSGQTQIGNGAGSTGTLTQSGGTLMANGGMNVGYTSTSSGAFNLSGGAATVTGDLYTDASANQTATVTQSGGVLTVTGDTLIGENGTGSFTLSSGTANLQGNLYLGDSTNSTGTLTQSGGTLTVTNGAYIGNTGTGTYSMGAGAANFNGGLTIGNAAGGTDSFTQDGGTVTLASGTTLIVGQTSSSYNLNGGTLTVGDNGGTNGIDGAGTFNFGGGTLAVQGTTLTDALNGTITGSGTISAPSATVNLDGALSGDGSLIVTGNSTTIVNLLAVDSYTGGTTVNDGTLNANIIDFPTAGPISIASGATLNLTGAVNTKLNSSLAGGGTLDTGSYQLELTGSVDFTGTTNLGASGGLQVFGGTLGNITGTNANLTLGGDTTVATSGTLNLTGTNSFTGTTTINSGFTLYADNLDSTTTNNVGTLGSNGTAGTQFTFGVAGAGAYYQPQGAQEGTLAVRLIGTAADSFYANNATLYGTIAVSGYSKIGTTTYTIFTTSAGNLTTGMLNNSSTAGLYAVDTNSALLTVTLSKSLTNDNLYLNATQLPITTYAQTPNQVAVATSLDAALGTSSTGNALFTAFDNLSASQIPDALDQLSPRGYLYMRDMAFENSTFMVESLDNRLAAIRSGYSGLDTSGLSIINPGMDSGLGRSLNSLLAFNNQGLAPNGVNYYPEDGDSNPSPSPLIEPSGEKTISDSTNPDMAPTTEAPKPYFQGPNLSEFVSGDVILSDLNQNANNEPAAHSTAGDATAGIAFKMSSKLAAGVLFDYNHTDARTDSEGSHVRSDTYSPGLFATLSEGGFYANGIFTFGYTTYSNNRNINFAGVSSSASSSPNGQDYVGDLDFGYDFHPIRNDHHLIIGPTAGIDYTHFNVDSFAESGAGLADLSVNSQSADSLRARVGGHVVYQIRSGPILFLPNFTASYQHEFLDDPYGLTSNFSIPNTTPFTIQGSNPGRDTALLGLGLTAALDNSMNIYLNYLAEVGGSNYFIQSVQGGVKATF